MWKLGALLLLFCIGKTHGECVCYQTSNYTGKSAPISNSYNTDDFSACYALCSYVAYSGDDTYGWTSLNIRWATTTNSGGIIQIFDGPSESDNLLIQIPEGEDVLDGSPKSSIKSSSPSIRIKYMQTGTGANVYYGVIKAVPGLQPIQATTTTTVLPSTTPFSDPNFVQNPQLISHDILVVVNQKTSGGLKALNNLGAIANNFVSKLSTTTDVNSASKSRLSLATLTPYFPYYSVRGEIWGLNASMLNDDLPQNGVTIDGSIDSALTNLLELAFVVNTNSSTDTRSNAQRSIILLTAEWPTSNAELNETVIKPLFDKKGVSLLVIGFNLTDIETSQVLRPNRWYNAINLITSDPKSVASFVNPFYFNDKSATNFWCPAVAIYNDTDNSGATFSAFKEPNNYNGPDGNLTNTNDWTMFNPYDGQAARYCHFANNQYVYKKPTEAKSVKVVVFYELEAGKDTLNFYDSSNSLIASFTGYDIAEGSFYTTTDTLTAVFTSDYQSVYRGFYVKIYPQSS